MIPPIDTRTLAPVAHMVGQDEAETVDLRAMLEDAESYLQSFAWCPPIVHRYFGMGVGGVVALFLFGFEHPIESGDQWLWVVTGDLPSAYLVTDDAKSAADALSRYCELMEAWADAVDQETSLDDVFPVAAAATHENAESLHRRVQFLRENVI